MDWNQFFYDVAVRTMSGLIVSAILVPILFFLYKLLTKKLTMRRATLTLLVPEILIKNKSKIGLLFVRNGSGEWRDETGLQNKDYYFKKQKDSNKYFVNVYYIPALGFQFKCFVKIGKLRYEEIKNALASKGYEYVKRGAGKEDRAYFILPQFDTCAAEGGFENNFYFPK